MRFTLLTALICLLVHQLGADSYYTREMAHQRLKGLMPYSGTLVRKAMYYDKDAEVAVRCYQIVETKPVVLPQIPDRFPCIDSLPDRYSDRLQIIAKFLKLACRQIPAKDVDVAMEPPYDAYRLATKLYAYHLIEDGMPFRDVMALIAEMNEIDKGRRQ